MSESLLERVEQKMKNSLELDQGIRQKAKSSLPLTILRSEENSPVTHLFEIPSDQKVFGVDSSEKPRFGVVTMNGCITVYDTMFRRITWKGKSNLTKVSWGVLSWIKRNSISDPVILVQSRDSGFHLVKSCQDSNVEDKDLIKVLSPETHIGFCKPYLCSNLQIVVPVGSNEVGIHIPGEGETNIHPCYSFSSMIMAMKEVSQKELSSTILCTTEDGFVHLIQVKGGPGETFEAKLLSQLLLPNPPGNEEQPTGLCIEGHDNVFVIGTNSRYMFLIKWTTEDSNLKPYGKKILPTDGVNCMTMRTGKEILAAGCFDGTVRIFSFPEMNQISTINYHNAQIHALLFINEKVSTDGKWYLLSSATDGGISVWNVSS